MIKIQSYHLPGTLLKFGENAFSELPSFIQQLRAKRILLVCSKGQLKRVEKLGDISSFVESIKVTSFSFFSSHPTLDELKVGVEHALKFKPDLVIGIGGGSAMDMAKSISLLLTNVTTSSLVKKIIAQSDIIKNNRVRLIQIPTTAGTGSEVTRWATIWDTENGRKLSFEDQKLYADMAILDPILTATMSKRVAAISGMDAFSHAIEAYWSKNASFLTDNLALMAVGKIWANLEEACREPSNIQSKAQMLEGSLLAGLAINGTKTTAVHSISYALTLQYNIPHGAACAMLLPELLKFNYEIIPEKLNKLIGVLGTFTVDKTVKIIRTKIRDVGLPITLTEAGVKNIEKKDIINKVYAPERMENNPRKVTESDLEAILKGLT